MQDILHALPATLELVLVTIFLQVTLSTLGVLAAIYRDSWIDNLTRIISLIGVVTPGFVLAIIFQLMASYYRTIFPVTGRLGSNVSFEAGVTEC